MFFNRVLLNIKHRSNATLRSWTYQCESILAQRSRRIQQLFTFYQRVYGPQELRQVLWHSYQLQLQPPLRRFMLSAVGVVGLAVSSTNSTTATTAGKKPANSSGFDWKHQRLSVKNFEACRRDIEFIDTLPRNKLCPLCKEKGMQYCYCLLGNKKCPKSPADGGISGGEPSIRNCRRPLGLQAELGKPEGVVMIEAADESTWEPYFSRNEFSIWRREERSAMYSYKVYARFDDISAADLLQVQTNIDYRKQWDETAVALEMVEEDPLPGTNSHLIYWEMQWPKMFANRDYVYCRRYVTDEQRKLMLICNRGARHPKYPQYPSKVRVTDYWSYMVIKPFRNFQEPGVHYILTYYDDPGLPIPQSIKSWVTQKQMPDFLKKMYQATKQYSCKDAHEMKQLHHLSNLKIANTDYTANVERTSWLRRMWQHRDAGQK